MISQGVKGLKFEVIILLLKIYIHAIQITDNEFDCDHKITDNEFDCDHKITYKSFPTLGIFDKFYTSSNMGKTHVKVETMSHSQSNS
jgi:hypothetical protein